MGNNHLYRLSCPKRGGEDNNENEEPVMNYEQAMKEISVNELAAGGWSQTCLNNVLITIVYRSYLCNNAEKITRNALITIEKKDSQKIRKRIRMEIKSVKLRNS